MVSDNGFTYSAEELRSLPKLPGVKKELGRQGVTWKFILKRALWYGIFWERLVGLTKSAIKKVLGRCHISLMVLMVLETIIIEIEAVLNDHPLTFVSSELGDVAPLTPANLCMVEGSLIYHTKWLTLMNLLIQAMVIQIPYADKLSPSSDITRLLEEMAK